MLGGIQHHFDDAFNIAIDGCQGADVHAEAPCNRGANQIPVKDLALDLA